MNPYYLRIGLHLLVWSAALSTYFNTMADEYWRLLGIAGYFVCFFILPLLVKRPHASTTSICLMVVLAVYSLFPAGEETMNAYVLLIAALIIWEAIQRLNRSLFGYVLLVQTGGLVLLAVKAELDLASLMYLFLYVVLLYIAAMLFQHQRQQFVFTNMRYDTLLQEYRNIKRRSAADEDYARQEERTLIGHEIHDSVGHKLTALLMRIETLRLKQDNPYHQDAELLKRLAQDSLEETRRAVKAYRHGDSGSLQGIMRLIRKLETDSFLRIYFTVNHGAFSVPLTGEQSFAIYRSVQEALTNIMKHSKTREAKVMFEAPGGRVFRFEITNPVASSYTFREGYGLTSMRERLHKMNGDLEVSSISGQFIVRGWLRLQERRED